MCVSAHLTPLDYLFIGLDEEINLHNEVVARGELLACILLLLPA
jgi:hypothetical protein